jgi:hypothetical protein
MQEFIYGEAPRLALKANSTSLKDRACLIYQAIHLQTEGGTKTVRGSISDFIRGGQLPPEYYLSARTKKKVAQTTLIGRFVAGLAWLDENKYIKGKKHGIGDWSIELINANPPSGEQLKFQLGSNMAEHKKNIREINGKMVSLEGLINDVWEDIGLIKVDLNDYRKTALEVPRQEIDSIKNELRSVKLSVSQLVGSIDEIQTELARPRKKFLGIF